MKAAASEILARSARRGNGAAVSGAFQACRATGTPPDAPALLEAILDCHPDAAPAMMEGLRALSEDPVIRENLPALMVYSVQGTGRLIKLLTVLSLTGFETDRESLLLFEDERAQRHARRLEELQGSAHARLEARRIEPKPDALIARPWWHPFYGTDANRFPGDLKIWQRFLLPFLTPRTKSRLTQLGLVMAALVILAASLITL